MTNTTARAPFYWMRPAERTTLARTTEQAFEEAKSTVAAFIIQRDREVPQPLRSPTPAAVIEMTLRDTAGSSDELDAGLFDHIRADDID